MSSAASSAALRKRIEERFQLMATELENVCELHIETRLQEEMTAAMQIAARDAREAARRELADYLNQTVRRLRQAEELEDLGSTLADAGVAFCNVAAVFAVTEGEVRGVRARGMNRDVSGFPDLRFPVSQAAAFAGVVSGEDPVIAMSTPPELSGPVVEFFGHRPEDRVCLFPLAVDGNARAVLFASGDVQMAPLELLAQAASASLEMQARRAEAARQAPPRTAELLSILPAPKPPKPAWEDLDADEQRLHLRAQRFARVQVAEMRLYKPDAVKAGRASADLYQELRETIDSAREAYRDSFVRNSSTMVDYLHLELLGTLANEDEALLGKGYPGPLV